MEVISSKDRQILQDLAKKQFMFSQSEQMQQLRQEWTDHNDCHGKRPMITVELGTFAQDVIPDLLKCEGELARSIEWDLHSNIVNHELFHDDSIVKDYIPIGRFTKFVPFDIPIQIDHVDNSVGHHFVEVIHDLQQDFHLLKPSTFSVDTQKREQTLALYHDLFDGIIPVKVAGSALYAVPTQDIVHIMSMENMMFSMYDYPDEFHQMMSQLTDDYLAYFQFIADNGLLLPTTQDEHLAQGSYSFTTELPNQSVWETRPFTTKDVWGFMDSQETSGISPDMYEEFIFPYYQKICNCYGLLSYGCCEAVDPIWENCLSKLKNLRKISISPWCNEEFMGEQLRGKRIVYQRKPSPSFLGVGSILEEDKLREHIRKTVHAAKGCTLEFSQRDVYTLGNTYQKVARYVEILREECENF